MPRAEFERLRVYRLSEIIADELWSVVMRWEWFARSTLGSQLTRAADSIGANIAEGSGRKSFVDNKRFVKIARGSALEVRHWLRRAYRRGLLEQREIESLSAKLDLFDPMINAYLVSIGRGFARKGLIPDHDRATKPRTRDRKGETGV